MAAPSRRFPLPRSNLSAVTEASTAAAPAAAAATDASGAPARGREMRANLLSKLRAPPLVHTWEFWHEKPDPAALLSPAMPTPMGAPFNYPNESQRTQQQHYEPILTHLLNIQDIKTFWSLFNNFDFSVLPQRTSVHLFHTTIKPVWEDPRNLKGGAWTFRVPKAAAVDFWQNLCLLAIGEHLQEAVRSERTTFRDDICGVSFRPRFSSVLVTVWNRDGQHEEGIRRIAETVVKNMPEHLKPKEGSYYYKKHSEHAGFDQEVAKKNAAAATPDADDEPGSPPGPPPPTAAGLHPDQAVASAQAQHDHVSSGIDAIADEVEKVKRALEKVELEDEAMAAKLADAGADA